ncbi:MULTISPECIES: host attachment protein [Methylomonas]|uniref:host attachment protein n=1 Tax=Methylomonas TaxID=416 RepID=UPI0012329159|nr:host attachment protein [Methylomonas rhizoryzae]
MNTQVIVADSSRARFFTLTGRNQPMTELDGMIHEEGRMRAQDETSDRQGGIAGGHGEGDHTFEAPTDFKHHEGEVFARQIAARLEQGRVNHEFNQLILVASPAFLGTLRQVLGSHLLEMVSHSLDKNLVAADEAAIREHIL